MKLYKFSDVSQEIAQNIKDQRLIPILGSGFSYGCKSRDGKVPTGDEMLEYMINCIQQNIKAKDADNDKLHQKTFSQISTYYHNLVPVDARRQYIRDNFTNVVLDSPQKDFLTEINWLYIYTLNMDDAIEKNSKYDQVILSNKEVEIAALEDYSCTIKLHGDANSYLLYKNDDSQVFDFKQYAQSISKNESLLKKLRDDFTYNNLVFIGCSLSDEFDLATLDTYENENTNSKTSKYYCTVRAPDEFKIMELEEYGITHVIVFDKFSDIYLSFLDANRVAKEISVEGIESNCNIPTSTSTKNPTSYLLHGKNPYDINSHMIYLPPFFINRDIEEKLISDLDKKPIHVLYGPRVSGKTYALLALVKNISDRKVYFFDSRDRIGAGAFDELLKKTKSLFLFDTHSLSKDQIFTIIHNPEIIRNNDNHIVITVSTSDKDIISVFNNTNKQCDIKGYFLASKFSSDEIKNINTKLNKCEIPVFSERLNLIDNIIAVENTLETKSMYSNIAPRSSSTGEIVVLILLAVNEKLYTTDLSNYDIDLECNSQIRKASPLISTESSLYFERDIQNTSKTKYVLNAKYWLFKFLGDFAETTDNHEMIIEAYQHIVRTVISQNKKKAYSASMDYIKFDVINEIFWGKSKGQLGLAKKIYENLSSLLAENPHYYHQRAKCYLWQSGFLKSDLVDLEEALKYANISQHNFKVEYEKTTNEKLAISLAHVNFTIALIRARISDIHNNQNSMLWESAIDSIYSAFIDPYNQNDFENEIMKKNRKRNSMRNVVEFIPSDEMKKNRACMDKLEQIYTKLISMS